MIKVSVMYPNTPGARFDHEYYRDKHMPLVKSPDGRQLQVLHGGQRPRRGDPGHSAHLRWHVPHLQRVRGAFQAGFGPHAKEIMADIANYTDLTPVIQISEVVVDHS